MNLRIQHARGKCYNACSTITGTKNGVGAQTMKLNEKCLLTHLYCHSLNLAVRNAINIRLLKDTLDKAYEITKLLRRVLKERQNSTENKQTNGT